LKIPAYTGDVVYGDTRVVDAHLALIGTDTFQRVPAIADARVKPHTQRAVRYSGYCLASLIICPQCGNK
jgi:hypothetical protein